MTTCVSLTRLLQTSEVNDVSAATRSLVTYLIVTKPLTVTLIATVIVMVTAIKWTLPATLVIQAGMTPTPVSTPALSSSKVNLGMEGILGEGQEEGLERWQQH